MQTAFTEDMRNKTLEERKAIYQEREQQILKEIKEGHEDDKYEMACQSRNAKSFLPLLFGLILLIVLWCAECYISGILLFLLSIFISAICSTIASNMNVKDAKYYDLTDASKKRVQKEKINASMGAASIATGTFYVGKHTKDAVKEIRNPDSWKEMK